MDCFSFSWMYFQISASTKRLHYSPIIKSTKIAFHNTMCRYAGHSCMHMGMWFSTDMWQFKKKWEWSMHLKNMDVTVHVDGTAIIGMLDTLPYYYVLLWILFYRSQGEPELSEPHTSRVNQWSVYLFVYNWRYNQFEEQGALTLHSLSETFCGQLALNILMFLMIEKISKNHVTSTNKSMACIFCLINAIAV